MSYIKDLRKYVGHEPILTAGVGLLVFNNENEILMQLRTDYNQWGFPGGSMELGESFEETAALTSRLRESDYNRPQHRLPSNSL